VDIGPWYGIAGGFTHTMATMNDEASVRLDVWLWAARWFKTRALARQAIESGRVLAQDQACKPAHPVRAGTRLEIRRGQERYQITVREPASRRGSATVAAGLYLESEESQARRERDRQLRRAERAGFEPPPSRPDKRARRLIRALGDIDMA